MQWLRFLSFFMFSLNLYLCTNNFYNQYLPCSDLDHIQKIIICDDNMDLSSFKTLEFLLDKISVVEPLHSMNFDDIISSRKYRESDGSNTGAIDEVSKNIVDVLKLKK